MTTQRKKIYSFLFIFSFLLGEYRSGIPGIKLTEILLIILCIVSLRENRGIDKVGKVIFVFYCLTVISFFSVSIFEFNFICVGGLGVYSRLCRYIAYGIIIISSIYIVDEKSMMIIYQYAVIIVASYMILQFFAYYFLDLVLPVKLLPFLEWGRSDGDVIELRRLAQQGYFRSYGIFGEPGYAALFFMPYITMNIGNIFKFKRNINRIISFMIVSGALFFTFSLQAIIVYIVTILAFVGNQFIKGRGKCKKFECILLIMFSAFCIILLNSNVFTVVLERIKSIKTVALDGGGGSIAIRLFRGFAIFFNMPLKDRIFGCGLGNIGNYVLEKNIVTKYDASINTELAVEFVNGISEILIATGILGFCVFCYLVVMIYRRSDIVSKLLLLEYILFLFAGNSCFTVDTIFYFVMICMCLKKKTSYENAKNKYDNFLAASRDSHSKNIGEQLNEENIKELYN